MTINDPLRGSDADDMTPVDGRAEKSRPSPCQAPARKVRPSLSIGVAFLVLATLLGMTGGAGAAGLLTGRNIRDDSLRSSDFRDGSIGAAKLRDAGLGQRDVSFDLTGDPGPTGGSGPPGPAGIGAITYRTGTVASARDRLHVSARCADGETALSGGAEFLDGDPGILANFVSTYRATFGAWDTFITAPGGFVQYRPWVVCATIP